MNLFTELKEFQLGISNLRVILSFNHRGNSSLLLVLISLMIGVMEILGFLGYIWGFSVLRCCCV